MKSKLKTLEDCTSLFEIEVSKDKITAALEEVYDEITKIADIPGFRTGKAPKELVRKHYGKNARDEALKRLIPEAYRKALEEHRINPVGLPEITDVNFENDEVLSFKARVDTRPKFRLKDYKALKLTRKKAEVSNEEIDKTIDNLRQMSAKYLAVEDRPVEMGDYAVSDMECFVDGKPAHKKRENLWFYVDKESLVPELSQGMVGMKKGEEKDIEAAIPEKYPDKKLAGKRARYHVSVKQIKTRVLPDLSDEFAKELGRETFDILKKEVAGQLEERLKAGIEMDVENQLLNRLMDDNVFSVPSSMAARQLEYMVEDAKRRLEEKGFRKEDLDKNDKELKDKFKEDAVRRVRLLFILDEIASSEKIDAGDEDVEEAYRAIAAQSGKPASEIKRHYEKEDIVDSLKDKIREAKTIQFLLKNAQVTNEEGGLQ